MGDPFLEFQDALRNGMDRRLRIDPPATLEQIWLWPCSFHHYEALGTAHRAVHRSDLTPKSVASPGHRNAPLIAARYIHAWLNRCPFRKMVSEFERPDDFPRER